MGMPDFDTPLARLVYDLYKEELLPMMIDSEDLMAQAMGELVSGMEPQVVEAFYTLDTDPDLQESIIGRLEKALVEINEWRGLSEPPAAEEEPAETPVK